MASPQTKIIGGTPAQTVSYALAPGVFQYIESVLVEVDGTAGPDATPTLFVKTQDGQVIATKRQGGTIPAGDTGTATWALRLTDETTGGDWVLISTVTLTADGLITFASIPQTFRSLRLEATLRPDADLLSPAITVNGYVPGSAVYTFLSSGIQGNGGVPANPSVDFAIDADSWERVTGTFDSPDDTLNFVGLTLDLPDYRAPLYKNMVFSSFGATGATAGVYTYDQRAGGGTWRDVAPVTSVEIYGNTPPGVNLLAGSRASLYGLR